MTSARLVARVLWRILPAGALVLLVIWVAASRVVTDAVREQVSAGLERAAAQAAHATRVKLEGLKAALESLAARDPIRRGPRDPGGAAASLRQFSRGPDLHETPGGRIRLVDRSGRIVAATDDGVPHGDQPWLVRVMSGRAVVDISPDGLVMAVPVRGIEGFEGALVMERPLSALAELLPVPFSSRIVLVRNGERVAVYTSQAAGLPARRGGPDTPGGAWIAARSPVEGFPGLALEVAEPAQVALAPAYWAKRVILIAFALALLALGGGLALAAGLATGPLRRFAEGLNRIHGADDLSRRMEPAGAAELQALATSINRMLDKVERAAAAHDHTDAILNSLNEMLIVTDPGGEVRLANRTFVKTTGWSLDDLRQRGLDSVVHGLANLPAANTAAGAVTLEGTLVTRDQRDIPVEISVARLNHRPAGGSNGILVLSDVSARKTAERELRHLARHDTLTGLANRAVFLERLEDALAQAKRTNAMVALLLLDLDNFKGINDSLGHPVGDGLLKGVAERLSRGTRETDTVARLGGDEFAIIATNLPESGGAAEVARKLIQALSIPFWIDGREIRATTSIGISVFPVEESDPDILLKHADFAMYQAKANGPGTWQFYDAEMNARRQARKSMEEDLDRALEDEQFELHYQPKVHAVTGALTGVEALIRWNHSKRGVVSPEAFVPIAETTGRIAAIGDWILGRAIAQHMAWRDVGLGRIPIAINLSPVQFRTGCVANTVRRIAARFDVDPHDIGLEITEGTIIENVDDVIRQLHELREIGYKIFIDDFGTGYSSLAYLKKLPIDALKIDRAFVSRITEDKHDAAIAKAIIDMARSLRLSTVAEGVETPAQLALLRAQGCTEIQGYLFSTPLGADEFAAWFRARGRAPAHGDLHRALDPSS